MYSGDSHQICEVRPLVKNVKNGPSWPIKKQPKKYSALFLAIVNRLERRESRRPAVQPIHSIHSLARLLRLYWNAPLSLQNCSFNLVMQMDLWWIYVTEHPFMISHLSGDFLPMYRLEHLSTTHLVGALEHVFSPYIGNVIIPTDELIFFRGIGQPPTSHDS